MSNNPSAPAQVELKKLEVSEKLIKSEKLEKVEKIEIKEKPEKAEHKEKPEKFEHKEKPEKFEHKEKPEKTEFKEKEHDKLSQIEKLTEVLPTDPATTVEQRLTAVEQSVASLQHFITTGQRPDLSRGALAAEATPKKSGT
jgi:hypothetical protein